MTIKSSKGSHRMPEQARKLVIRALKGAIVRLMRVVLRLEGVNSTVESKDRYDRPLGDDRYSRPQGSR